MTDTLLCRGDISADIRGHQQTSKDSADISADISTDISEDISVSHGHQCVATRRSVVLCGNAPVLWRRGRTHLSEGLMFLRTHLPMARLPGGRRSSSSS